MALLQAWLVQRVVREVLPLVIDTVRSQLRARQAPAAVEGAAPPAISPETEARLTALQDDLRNLELSVRAAQDELGRKLDRMAFWNKALAGTTAVLALAVLYLLLR